MLTLKGGDFVLEKVVAHTGDATLRLSQGKDVVTIAISQSGFHVARGQKRAFASTRGPDKQDKLDAVRALLLWARRPSDRSSGWSRRWKSATKAKRMARSRSSALVDGAIVQLLDGDADAPRRIAKRITRKHRAALRVVKARRAPGMFRRLHRAVSGRAHDGIRSIRELRHRIDRIFLVEQRPRLSSCARWEWAIRSQQYIWQFIGCFMFPW